VCEGVVSQQLLPTADGKGRIAAIELMFATPAIKNLIREGKTYPTILKDDESIKSEVKIKNIEYPVKKGDTMGIIKYYTNSGDLLG
ncbi:hypothetical protein ACTPEF_25070, partial [Clostridioides difficile]